MQFKIRTFGSAPDIGAIERTVGDVDPSAVIDIDVAGEVLRISTMIGDAELVSLINQAGYRMSLDHLERVPSECCGGCGG